MKCPKCSDRSEVLQTIGESNEFIMRRRRCLNPSCMHRFKTRESRLAVDDSITTESVAKQLNLGKRKDSKFDAEALAAALATDKRRAQIKRDTRRKAREDEWESERWDRAPRKLTREQARKEIEGF